MKKLIAILAVFAFLGAALFAQDEGSWSVGGSGQVRTQIDFLPLFNDGIEDSRHAQVNSDVPDIGDVRGNFSLTYGRGGLSTGLSFNQKGKINSTLTYNGANFQFNAEQSLVDLLNGTQDSAYDYGKLWGFYKFLDGMIYLEAAAKGRDEQFWNSSGTAGDSPAKEYADAYLVLNVLPPQIEGLSFGFKLPNLFVIKPADRPKDFMDEALRLMTFGVKYSSGPLGAAAQFGLRNYQGIADQGLNRFYAGATYKINDQMSAEFAFLGDFWWGDVTTFDKNRTDPGPLKTEAENLAKIYIGLGFTYDASPLNASIKLRYFNEEATYGGLGGFNSPYTAAFFIANAGGDPETDTLADVGLGGLAIPRHGIENGKLRIEPAVQYDVIPTTLRVKLGTLFELPFGDFTYSRVRVTKDTLKDMFGMSDDDAGKAYKAPQLYYEIAPEIQFNFLGTGAGNTDTGFVARYRVRGYAEAPSQTMNSFDMVFKWKF
jgi:hypothetical protein